MPLTNRAVDLANRNGLVAPQDVCQDGIAVLEHHSISFDQVRSDGNDHSDGGETCPTRGVPDSTRKVPLS